MNRKMFFSLILLVLNLIIPGALASRENHHDDSISSSSAVGVAGRIEGLVLPGSELQVAPLNDRKLPIMLRVIEAWKHGDSYRYDLEFIGLEAGDFDLGDYLERKDGTALGALPAIPVRIRSLLPPGQIIPHDLASNLPAVARYRIWILLAAIGWLFGLIWLVAWKRRDTQIAAEGVKPQTFAELLEPRLKAASSGDLSPAQLAELERFIVEFWRRRLQRSDLPLNQAIFQLRQHAQAGPLLKQLEQWIHAPRVRSDHAPSDTDSPHLAVLLQPYQDFPADMEEGV
jgi:hypothetical protein